ncbi:replication initiator protein A [Deinococcus koreensis]|uniref:Plasmid replication initiator protein n=1 Tax=Deinococcus koreensis TaxID=2054903 RepID=A0A2K3US23_9DEIO|nr:replication initiator protein A [Deinococcus koreensis]PNY79352.1 plasmid replication initiator protein [Deinococcus koreensis]
MAVKRKSTEMTGQAMQRLTEANVARLGLISIQERIPADFTRWAYEFEIDGRTGELSCFGPAEYGGVPHGLDGDIANAFIDLFIEQGAPEDGRLSTTASQVLARAGLHSNGHYHRVLTESLRRLKQATYTMSHAWRDHEQQRWTSGTFSYVLDYDVTSGERDAVTEGAVLSVTLARQIVKSIRARYVKPLDYVFLTTLERPLTRALYRLLDAKRYDPHDLSRTVVSHQVNLLEWAAECKIVDRRTDKVRRTLEGAHEELQQKGYLQDVTYEGRGRKQTLTYLFGAPQVAHDTLDPPLVEALVERRVARPVARKLVATRGEAHVRARLAKFEALLASGYKARNPSALLVDVIQDDAGKYLDPELPSVHVVTSKPPPTPSPEQQAQEDAVREAAFRAQDLEAQAEQALRTLQLLLKTRLTTEQYARLRSALEAGRADAALVVREVTKAVFEGRADAVVAELAPLVTAPEV